MATTLTVNGITYSFPQTGDQGWGDNVTNWASAVTSGMLQKSGGSFVLTAEVDFGSSFGLKALSYKSRGTNVASAGVIRLANAELVSWRNNANGADLSVAVNSSDKLQFNSVDLVDASSVQTLTNKTISAGSNTINISGATASNFVNVGTVSLPTATTTLVGRDTTDTLTNKTLTAPIIATISNTGTITLPTATTTLVGRDTTDTLTNKTLTAPVIATISNSGTLTLPTGADTLVGRASTDTLTNKTLTAPVIATISNSGTLTLPTGADTLVGRASTDTLTNKTLTTPTINQPIINGVTDGSSAAAGVVGQVITANSAGLAIASTDTVANLTSISLTAGDWDVYATAVMQTGLTGVTRVISAISTSSAAFDSTSSGGVSQMVWASFTPPSVLYLSVSMRRISVSATTTVFLVGRATYTGGSGNWSADSIITARRAR